jgi:hypothetical protein
MWKTKTNPDPFEITPRGDPTATLASMITIGTFDRTTHYTFSMQRKGPRP